MGGQNGKRRRAESKHSDRETAIEAASVLAREATAGQVIIHKENKLIEAEYSFGNDPRLEASP